MDNINEQKRYAFKKAYQGRTGIIPENSTIDYVHGCIYINGGLCDPYSSEFLRTMISNKSLREEYLKELVIPVNKI